MEVRGNRVLVVGAGKSGVAAARFLAERGAQVTVTDKRSRGELAAPLAELGDRVKWEVGGHIAASFTGADFIIVSPGVPALPELAEARARAIPVIGEIELAARFIRAPLVGITGTNGKSTVTAMCGEIARATGRPTFVGGNLGTALITAVGSPAAGSGGIVIAELSSFQLETVETLHPRAAVFTNLTPDHLDRYASLDDYARAKLRLAARMTPEDAVVLCADAQPMIRAWQELGPRHLSHAMCAYSTGGQLAGGRAGGWIDGDALVVQVGSAEERYPIAELQVIGRHNLANALASILAMRASGLATAAQTRGGLASFRPLPHRMQLVGEKRGVRFYDDSKATNVDSVVAGLDGFPVPFVLIAGGRDKGGSYAPLVQTLKANPCKSVVLIGEASELIAKALAGTQLPHEHAATLEAAVARGATLAKAGEAVVLSPACASYDMFKNYEHRGQMFRAVVEALPA